jgi:hypothetical protein
MKSMEAQVLSKKKLKATKTKFELPATCPFQENESVSSFQSID